MTSPLVETKLHIPKLRRRLVARPRLSGRLRHGAESRLTLVSAPAGFGKTTLLTEWLAATPAGQRLVEPLSDRELDVLRLLGSDLDGPDIARELAVSLNTLRTHTRNIYAELGVNNRRAAVRQAAELNLLSPTRHR